MRCTWVNNFYLFIFFLFFFSKIYRVSVSPSPKKGHGKVAKKGHFQRAAACQKGTFSVRRKAKGTFLSDLWHAGMAHLSRVIRFNTDVILLCNLLFSICFSSISIFQVSLLPQKN